MIKAWNSKWIFCSFWITPTNEKKTAFFSFFVFDFTFFVLCVSILIGKTDFDGFIKLKQLENDFFNICRIARNHKTRQVFVVCVIMFFLFTFFFLSKAKAKLNGCCLHLSDRLNSVLLYCVYFIFGFWVRVYN